MILNSYYPNKICLKDILNCTGITIPTDAAPPCNNYQISDNVDKWGIHINKLTITALLDMLRQKGIPISMELVYANTLMDWQFEDLVKQTFQHSHIICGYDYDWLTKRKLTKKGHASILMDYNNDHVILFNPHEKDTNLECTLYDLYNAMLNKNNGFALLLRMEIK